MSRIAQLPTALGFVWLMSALGCASVPKDRIATDRIHVQGNDALSDSAIKEKLASRETKRFFGLFPGVLYDYALFNRYVLERDLQRVERQYRSLGYYHARVRAGRVLPSDDGKHVRVEIIVDEGEPSLLSRVDVYGLRDVPDELAEDAREYLENALEIGEPFAEEAFEKAANGLQKVLTDNGYAYAKVERRADVDLARHSVSAGFWVRSGRATRYGPVTLSGLGDIPEGRIRRTLDLTPGDPYSTAELVEAERQLLELGVFATVSVEPQLPGDVADVPGKTQAPPEQGAQRVQQAPESLPEYVPIHVRVERAREHSVQLGVGIQVDSIRSDIHLVAGWEDRNFLGGLRRFDIEARPGLVLHPTLLEPSNDERRLLPEFRLRTGLRQPGLIEARTNGFLRAESSIYPVLLTTEPPTSGLILGYRDHRFGAGFDRSAWRFFGAVSQNVQILVPFAYRGTLDADLKRVIVSYPELFTTLDLRDDRIDPNDGAYLANTLQFAGVGGDAIDVKVQPEARGYLPLDDDLTFSARGTIGLLFPLNYGESLAANASGVGLEQFTRAEWVRDTQIVFLRGFFSGGTGSNRGYGVREIGPHGLVPFYNPGQSSMDLGVSCDPASPDYAVEDCDLPLGGLSLWELSLELRYLLGGALSGAYFVDLSDVTAGQAQFRYDHPHVSTGVGLRYATPVGPVRIDLGYRIPGLQYPEGSPDELAEPTTILGLPLALSFGIGEAF